MNLSLPNLRVRALSLPSFVEAEEERRVSPDTWLSGGECALPSVSRLRSLLALFALYAATLLSVTLLSDGADIGCILAGIAGHVLYASAKTALAWRDASWLEDARARGRRGSRPSRLPRPRFRARK